MNSSDILKELLLVENKIERIKKDVILQNEQIAISNETISKLHDHIKAADLEVNKLKDRKNNIFRELNQEILNLSCTCNAKDSLSGSKSAPGTSIIDNSPMDENKKSKSAPENNIIGNSSMDENKKSKMTTGTSIIDNSLMVENKTLKRVLEIGDSKETTEKKLKSFNDKENDSSKNFKPEFVKYQKYNINNQSINGCKLTDMGPIIYGPYGLVMVIDDTNSMYLTLTDNTCDVIYCDAFNNCNMLVGSTYNKLVTIHFRSKNKNMNYFDPINLLNIVDKETQIRSFCKETDNILLLGFSNGFLVQFYPCNGKMNICHKFNGSILALTQKNKKHFFGIIEFDLIVFETNNPNISKKNVSFNYRARNMKLLDEQYLIVYGFISISIVDIYNMTIISEYRMDSDLVDICIYDYTIFIAEERTIKFIKFDKKNRTIDWSSLSESCNTAKDIKGIDKFSNSIFFTTDLKMFVAILE